ncbi:enamine deaminase RidA (YjgF/YER057c/UK114 family) [Litorimonas taeanensis]|uniref:Enamine deaminase RidA (YjgF/YER057c/UK114 family) n=1 Tax=Litorimonas taeanensis TaxID=568099 RepID=A0A420WIK0_9PROT|nr:RidA family protein [Litorimonas taeanensis]RKQ70776.1 enamine deaminase RidA (YjgF/YER057c/UK114 family) [Litorimonas taeanensis]
MSESISRLNPSTLPNSSEMGYSQISIVEPGRMAYISGQVAWQADGAPVPEDIGEQAKIVVKNARSALKALGAKAQDIVLARIYIVDLNDAAMESAFPVLLELFEGHQPSITGIGVAALAGPELKVEVELTVRVPD